MCTQDLLGKAQAYLGWNRWFHSLRDHFGPGRCCPPGPESLWGLAFPAADGGLLKLKKTQSTRSWQKEIQGRPLSAQKYLPILP